MPLPDFNSEGDLPEGVHQATFDEIVSRFGVGTRQRQIVLARLTRVLEVAKATGKLERLVIFGSFITNKSHPNDVDIILIMHDDFRSNECEGVTAKLFNHLQATDEFGASVFWMRPSLLLFETIDEFIEHWQIKRDKTRRGIVEITR